MGTEVVADLIHQATPRLKPGGALLIEISPMIAAAVEKLIDQQPLLERGPTLRDLAGHSRVVQATRRI
jgi:release factor glutamine methyltransferase